MWLTIPKWVDAGLIPLINVTLAFLATGVIFLALDVDPVFAVSVMLKGAFGYADGVGYTLFYMTNFIFTGLAVAVAAHAGLFNIGGEGQALMGGLGIGFFVLAADSFLPGPLIWVVGFVGAALFGMAWALIPAVLQAYRGSHVVITTILFNFIAASIAVYLLVNVLIEKGSQSPETRAFSPGAKVLQLHDVLAYFGIQMAPSPLNLVTVWALLCCLGIWFLLWRTRWGYAIRASGTNPEAAEYAGIHRKRVIIMAMCISGALAGFLAVNEILGVQGRVVLNFTGGAGFAGIAVSLMGRNHPLGIILAALLFGVLFQGGAELAFEIPTLTRDMITTIQGLVILFSGALGFMFHPLFAQYFRMRMLTKHAAQKPVESQGPDKKRQEGEPA